MNCSQSHADLGALRRRELINLTKFDVVLLYSARLQKKLWIWTSTNLERFRYQFHKSFNYNEISYQTTLTRSPGESRGDKIPKRVIKFRLIIRLSRMILGAFFTEVKIEEKKMIKSWSSRASEIALPVPVTADSSHIVWRLNCLNWHISGRFRCCSSSSSYTRVWQKTKGGT